MVADVAVMQTIGRTRSIATTPETPFFAVSLPKLVVLSLCTIGFYQLYWFYQNWCRIKEREGLDISPFWRSFWGYFFCHECFTHIRNHAERKGVAISFHAGALTAGWIAANLSWNLPPPYSLIGYLAVVFLLPVQATVNRINCSVMPGRDPNSRFSSWNWLGIVVGGIFLLLVVIGAFCPKAKCQSESNPTRVPPVPISQVADNAVIHVFPLWPAASPI